MSDVPEPEFLTADALTLPGVRHGFFTRRGGRSGGLYAQLNMGLGSADDQDQVRANRQAAAIVLGSETLITPHQVHGAVALSVDGPWDAAGPRKADALVTCKPGLAIGIVTADCVPVLFADAQARVIGAAHAGWRGAMTGIVEATVDQMLAQGAQRSNIRAAIGPAIAQPSYEVGDDLRQAFLAHRPEAANCFAPGARAGKYQFDLGRVVQRTLEQMPLGAVEWLGIDTYCDEDRFFSFRRATHRQEPDYGRQLSAICLS